jgi:hypothetical protein
MSNSGKPAKKGKGSRLCKTINTGKLYLKFKCVCPGCFNLTKMPLGIEYG